MEGRRRLRPRQRRSALIRFRGGLFKPGDAYGPGTDSTMHRAFVDFIWRF